MVESNPIERPPPSKQTGDLPPTPLTLDGSFILHQMFRVRWTAWRALGSEKKHVLTGASATFSAMEANKQEPTGLFSLLGHKGDLMIVHFRKTLDEINHAELTVARTELNEYIEPTTSYLSVVELGLYEASVKIYADLKAQGLEHGTAEWNKAIEAELGTQRETAAARLWPEIPQRRYLCFYPMNKFRGETKNWYSEPIRERQRMMREHGMAILVLPQALGKAPQMYVISPSGLSTPTMSICSASQPSF